MSDDILFERRGGLALVTLNRPAALNALTLEMALALDAELARWETDPGVRAVLVKATGGRAFCAGGDIRKLYDAGRAGERYPQDFYANEYRLNTRIFHYAKPYVAFMDGVVMGGGVGLSVHGRVRVVTERTMFAMPETGIGLFPDVGGSWFLPRVRRRIGFYLALTGARMKAADALFAGVGDLYIPSERLSEAEAALAAADLSGDAEAIVRSLLARFAAEPGEAPLAAVADDIEQLFAGTSLEAVLADLAAASGSFPESTLATMRTKSPTSMKVTFRQLRQGGALGFNDCMRMEYRLACACMAGHDFYEGVRAVVVDKDQKPAWQPARLEEVTEALVARHFETVPPGGDLRFPSDPG